MIGVYPIIYLTDKLGEKAFTFGWSLKECYWHGDRFIHSRTNLVWQKFVQLDRSCFVWYMYIYFGTKPWFLLSDFVSHTVRFIDLELYNCGVVETSGYVPVINWRFELSFSFEYSIFIYLVSSLWIFQILDKKNLLWYISVVLVVLL